MSKRVETAIEEVGKLVADRGIDGDIEYFNYHKNRYRRMATTLMKHSPEGSKILEIGSHYLHSSMILKKLGYQVDGMDVSEFWSLDFVAERGDTFAISPIINDDLQQLASVGLEEESYDLILFTEILEHITFNPITFWQEIYRLLKPGGLIYVSTPNALSAQGVMRAVKNLISFKGIGNSLEMIFSQVTYGHHWKEYSYRELKRYFQMLSDEFQTSVALYSYQPFDKSTLQHFFWSVIRNIGNWTYVFSSDLEAVITLNKKSKASWKMQSPQY